MAKRKAPRPAKSPPKKATAKPTLAKRGPAKPTPSKKPAAKKSVAKKSAATKALPDKAAAKGKRAAAKSAKRAAPRVVHKILGKKARRKSTKAAATKQRRAKVVVQMAKEVDRKRAEQAAKMAASMQQEEVVVAPSRIKPENGATQGNPPVETQDTPQREIRPGFVSHTELASSDPSATKAWAEKVLGWTFSPPVPVPGGEYHLWVHPSNLGGGGVRATNPPERPGTIPYVEVPDIKAAYALATAKGAKVLMPPDRVPGGGFIAIVSAPGGVPIGFWAPK